MGVELYERAQKDFQPMFTKILKLNPDLIDLGSSPPGTAGLLIRQARELGYKGKFLKTGGAGPEEIVAVAGKEASEGLISVLYADPANPGFAKLSAEYEKTEGADAERDYRKLLRCHESPIPCDPGRWRFHRHTKGS